LTIIIHQLIEKDRFTLPCKVCTLILGGYVLHFCFFFHFMYCLVNFHKKVLPLVLTLECTKFFLPFIFYAHGCCMAISLYMCATKNLSALLIFAENFHPGSGYKILIKCTSCNFTFWMPGVIASFALPLHIPGNNTLSFIVALEACAI